MTDTTIPLHPGALYTYRPEGFESTVLTEVVSVGANGVRCENHLSSDDTPTTPPLAVVLDPASFGPTGEYVYAGDIRDHRNNPDVGDLFFLPGYDAVADGLIPIFAGPHVAEVIDRYTTVYEESWVIVQITCDESGDVYSWEMTIRPEDLGRYGRWVGTTRPVFDTPERYGT